MCLLDLEDAVAPAAKGAARLGAVDAIRNRSWGDKVVGVRVNSWRTEWTYSDLIAVVGGAGERLDEVVLPKVEDPAEVVAVDLLLSQVERAHGLVPGRIGLEAQIESAAGLSHVGAICASSSRLVAVVFGPADFAASMGLPGPGPSGPGRGRARDWLVHALLRMAVAGRTAGLQVIDGPYFQLHDPEGLQDSAEQAAGCGCDGKWAVHPEQLPFINGSFTPDQACYDRADALVHIYEKAAREQGLGALALNGEMVDEATRKVAARTLKRGAQAGMAPTPPAN
jgi:citrate lyase subunit beta/citryl-CoA lyase